MTRILSLFALAAIAGIVIWQLAANDDPEPTPAALSTEPAAIATAPPEPLPVLRAVPELVDIDGWMNTDATTFEANQGDVTVVQFWTFGCFNCKNTLDNLRGLYEAYGDAGLEIIGIHAPEFAYEADTGNIAQALIDLDVTWPVALDTDKINFRAWQEGPRNFWPRTYIVDGDGNIRFDHIGEGKYDELNAAVAQLLAEAA